MTGRGYTTADLAACYRALDVTPGRVVYLTGNLGRLGALIGKDGVPVRNKEQIVETHLTVLEDLLGPEGTLVFPTHSWGMVGSSSVFDPDDTPGDYLFGEVARRLRPSRRQLHPFASVAAIGAQCDAIIAPGLHRHAYGVGSPFWHMGMRDASHLSLGLEARRTVSAVHHCEAIAQVPYRYHKAFQKSCRIGNDVRLEEVYLHVTYLVDGGLKRDRNRKITALPPIAETIRNADLGRGKAQSLSLGTFIETTTDAMKRDPYIWLSEKPDDRPWDT